MALGQSYGTRDVIWKDMCSNQPQINTKKHWPSAYLLALGAILFLVVNSLAPWKFEWNFGHVIFKQILVINGWVISCEIALIWMSLDFTDEQSTLVQVMAWCHQATSHYLVFDFSSSPIANAMKNSFGLWDLKISEPIWLLKFLSFFEALNYMATTKWNQAIDFQIRIARMAVLVNI